MATNVKFPCSEIPKEMDHTASDTLPSKLTASQRSRIEKNKQKAIQLRQSRLAKIPASAGQICQKQSVALVGRPRDTGGGFLLEEEILGEEAELRVIAEDPALADLFDLPKCQECQKEFSHSFLQTNFNFSVCDVCRDKDEKHRLITKTEAKTEFLLKDCDLEKREPPLRFIVKRNPHAQRGDMKLYLVSQVEKRALEVWGSEEALEEGHDKREGDREKRKQKAFDRKVKALRMQVRSSLYRKEDKSHEHEYGPEEYNEDEDMYEKMCSTCKHKLSYEKM